MHTQRDRRVVRMCGELFLAARIARAAAGRDWQRVLQKTAVTGRPVKPAKQKRFSHLAFIRNDVL